MISFQEMLIILLIVMGMLSVVIFSAVWVYRDAVARGDNAAAIWTIGTVFLWPWVLIIYLIVRQRPRLG